MGQFLALGGAQVADGLLAVFGPDGVHRRVDAPLAVPGGIVGEQVHLLRPAGGAQRRRAQTQPPQGRRPGVELVEQGMARWKSSRVMSVGRSSTVWWPVQRRLAASRPATATCPASIRSARRRPATSSASASITRRTSASQRRSRGGVVELPMLLASGGQSNRRTGLSSQPLA